MQRKIKSRLWPAGQEGVWIHQAYRWVKWQHQIYRVILCVEGRTQWEKCLFTLLNAALLHPKHGFPLHDTVCDAAQHSNSHKQTNIVPCDRHLHIRSRRRDVICCSLVFNMAETRPGVLSQALRKHVMSSSLAWLVLSWAHIKSWLDDTEQD